MKQNTLAGECERLLCARQACKTEAAADTMTHEIGLLVCGHPETILAALRTDGEANSRAVSGEAVDAVIANVVREFKNWKPWPAQLGFARACVRAALSASKPDDASALLKEVEAINDIAVMMGEFVDNWPSHKKFSTSLKLIAKTLRAALKPPGVPGPNAAYPWQVYSPSDPHGNYDIGGPPVRVGDHDGGFPCIATVFGGKVDADYIVALHNAAHIGRDGA